MTSPSTLRDVLRAYAQRYPGYSQYWLQLALYLALYDDEKEEARRCFEKAVALNKESVEAHQALRLGVEEWAVDLSLTSLVLTSGHLTSLPPEIGQLTNLTSLRLRDNALTSLPPEIGQLQQLSLLRLNGNQLPGLPDEISYLPKLKDFQFRSNNPLPGSTTDKQD